MTRNYKRRLHVGYEEGAPRLAPQGSADRYGSGRNGVYAPEFDNPLCDKWKRQGWRYERQPKIGLFYPSPNGFNDPLSVALVVDFLMRIEPNYMMTSSLLADGLREQFPHIAWDSVTVGRIMMGLVEEAAQTSRPNHQKPPLEESRYTNGRVFRINPSPGNHYWLAQLREYFGNLAIEHVEQARVGEKPDRTGQIWADVTTLPWGVAPRWKG